jgi:hypothetical protein
MNHPLLKTFRRINRDIEVLTYILLVFLVIAAIRATILIYKDQYDQLWSLLSPTVPLLAALLIVRVANRLIVHNNIIREDDRRQEIVRTTHHLIAITKDLRARVGYCKVILSEGSPALTLIEIAKTIEDRYETLLDRDAYKYLPGKCVDIITKISGSIFGISLLAAGMRHGTNTNPSAAFANISTNENEGLIATLEELLADLQELIDELFKMRESIDA